MKYRRRVAHSSSGLGHLPLKEEITGSNPVCATIFCLGSGQMLKQVGQHRPCVALSAQDRDTGRDPGTSSYLCQVRSLFLPRFSFLEDYLVGNTDGASLIAIRRETLTPEAGGGTHFSMTHRWPTVNRGG
jgi:hypothetical protein